MSAAILKVEIGYQCFEYVFKCSHFFQSVCHTISPGERAPLSHGNVHPSSVPSYLSQVKFKLIIKSSYLKLIIELSLCVILNRAMNYGVMGFLIAKDILHLILPDSKTSSHFICLGYIEMTLIMQFFVSIPVLCYSLLSE